MTSTSRRRAARPAVVVVAAAAVVAGSAASVAAGPATVAGLTADPSSSTRVVMQFPEKAEDMLLSGTLERGELLSSRAGLGRREDWHRVTS